MPLLFPGKTKAPSAIPIPQYHRRVSIIMRTRGTCNPVAANVFLSQLYDTFVKLSNECPSISRRALFHFFKRAKSRPPYTASIKSPPRNFPRERVSLMRRSRNANAGCLSLRKRDAQTPRRAPSIAMAVIRRAMKRMEGEGEKKSCRRFPPSHEVSTFRHISSGIFIVSF